MKRCCVIGGAPIGEYDDIRAYLRDDDYIIACDGGLRHTDALGIVPDLIVGDFDSHEKPTSDIEMIVLPCEKDDTDTVYAVREAVKRGFSDFLLIGVCGGRLDHTLGNVSILLWLDTLGMRAVAVDDYAELEIVSCRPAYIIDSYVYFSLLNISGTAKGVTITGAKYPLSGADIDCEYQYAVSNEVLPGRTAEVTVSEGRLLLYRVRHE